MGKKTAKEVISGLLTSNSDQVLKQVQLVMKEQKVSPWEARNLLYLDALNFLEVNKAVPPIETLYTGERKKYYPIFKEKEKEFVSKPVVFEQTQNFKKEFEAKTGQKINLLTQYDTATGKIITRKPILKATSDWNNDASITGYLFGDDSEYAYDKDLTIKAYNELGFVKGGKYTDYNGIIKQLESDPKKKFLVEEKRAEIHSRNYEAKKLKEKYDVGQPNEQGMEVLKWMNNSVLTMGAFKVIEGVVTGDQRGQLAKELKQFNIADFGEMQIKDQIGKNIKFKADNVSFSPETKKDRTWEDVKNIGTQGLLSSLEFLTAISAVNKTAKGLSWVAGLSKVPKIIGKPIQFALKPMQWTNATKYADLGFNKVASKELGSRALQAAAIFPAKLLGAFETSAIYFGAINQGTKKYFNPHLRNSDPNISAFQQGLRDIVEGGVEGLTEQLVFFPKLNITGKALTKSAARNTLDLAIGVVSENLEEEVSRIVSDYFDLQYKGVSGGTSIIGDILNGGEITQEQVNEVLGVTLSTVALMGIFGTASKYAERSYKKDMVKTVEELVKKHVSYDRVAQILNDSFQGDTREKFIMRNAMEESQLLQQAFKIGLESGNVNPQEDLISQALKFGFDQLSEKESLSFLKNIELKAIESIRDNLINDVAKEVPALKAIQKKFKDPKIASYLVGNILQGNELTEEKIKQDLKALPEVNEIFNAYQEATNSIKMKEKKVQLDLLDEEIATLDQRLFILKAMPEEITKQATLDKILKEKNELVEARNILVNEGVTLKDVVDPLLVFAKYSAGKNRAFINENNLGENLLKKAQEMLQIATPYSHKIDVAIEYLNGIKKHYEQRIKSGELLGQKESLIYKQAIAELNKYNYYEYEKFNLPERQQYDVLENEVEFYKKNPEEYAKVKQLYLGSIIRNKFDTPPTQEEWQKAHDEFTAQMEQFAKDGKSTEEGLKAFFGSKYNEEISQMADYLIRLHKRVNGKEKTTQRTIRRSEDQPQGITFTPKKSSKPSEIPIPVSNPLAAFSENESGKWYQFYRVDLKKNLFLLREQVKLSEAVKKAILEYANESVPDKNKWIEFKQKFIQAYENNEPVEQDILNEYEYALPFFVIYDYLRKAVDVKNEGKYYSDQKTEGSVVNGPASVYTQVWGKISNFIKVGKITTKSGNAVDPASLQRDAEQLKPVETMQKLVDKNAPLKEETQEEINTQNELLKSFGSDIKQYNDFQKKYPNNLLVKKILFVYAIAKGKATIPFDGMITQEEAKDILTRFNLTVKEKLKVYLKGSIVANGTLTDDINNVPVVESDQENEEIKKELVKKLPKKIVSNEDLETLTNLLSNIYVGSKAQEIIDTHKKDTEIDIKDTPFRSPSVLERIYLEVDQMKNAPIFRGIMKSIIIKNTYNFSDFKLIPKTGENLKEIREFINKLAKAFMNEEYVSMPMTEHKNNIKFMYYALLKEIQKTHPELLHKININGEDLYFVKEVEGFDQVVKATVDKKGNVVLRKALEAPTEPVVAQTPQEPTQVSTEEKEAVLQPISLEKVEFLLEDGSMGLDKGQKKGFFVDPVTEDIYWKEANPTGSDIEDPRRYIYPFFEGEKGNDVIEKIEIVEPVIFKKNKYGDYELAQKGKANFYYRDGGVKKVSQPQTTQKDTNTPTYEYLSKEDLLKEGMEINSKFDNEQNQIIGLKINNELVGYTIVEIKDSIAIVKVLFVKDTKRQKGYGSTLIKDLSNKLFPDKYVDHSFVVNPKITKMIDSIFDKSQFVYEIEEELKANLGRVIKPQNTPTQEETTQSTPAEEIVASEPLEIATEEFTNKAVEDSVRGQYLFRYWVRKSKGTTDINYDIMTGSYFITVPLSEHFDLSKINGTKKQELFGFLLSRIRINNQYYLEDDIAKRLMFQKELIDTVLQLSKSDLTEEEFTLFKKIIHAGVNARGLDVETVRQLKYLDSITYEGEKLEIDAVKTISKNIIENQKLPVPEILTLSIKDLPDTNNFMYQGLYEQNGEIVKVLSSVQGIAVHEYIHFLFDRFEVKNNEEFKAVDKVVKDYMDQVITYWKARDYVGLSKLFDNINPDLALSIAKTLISQVDIEHFVYANKSASERVANLFSNQHFAELMFIRRHEGKSLAEPYLLKILDATVQEEVKDTLIREYLSTFETAIIIRYNPNVGNDDEIVEIETPKPALPEDFVDEVDLDIDPYGGFMSTKVRPELVDWSMNPSNQDFNTFNEEEADLIANGMKDLNEDLRIAAGITESGTIFDFVQGVTFDEFYELVKKPSEAMKETDPDMYNARMNLYFKFTKVLNNKFGHSSHIDYALFDNKPLMDQEKYVKRLLHDVFNKLNSVSYHQIFQIIAKQNPEFNSIDFVVKPLQKGKNADGETVSNYRPNMLILEKEKDFIDILNKIAGMNLVTSIKFKFLIDVLGKHLGEAQDPDYRQFISSDFENRKDNFSSQMMKTLTLIHQKDGGIFLNKFGDKNHNPVLYLNYSKKTLEEINKEQTKDHTRSPLEAFYRLVALPVYKKYREMGINDLKAMGVENPESLFLLDSEIEVEYNPLVVTLAMRALLEEMKKGATADNFSVDKDTINVSTFLRNENMITLMKRSTLVLEKMKMTVSQESLQTMGIEERRDVVPYQLVRDNANLPSVVHNGENVFFKVAFVTTKTMPIELQRIFRNKYGTFKFDGASFVVRRKFDKTYSELFGVLNEGVAKNVILPQNAFIKHAVHAISASDPIGQWMLKNNIAMLVFDESEKNKVLREENGTLTKDINTGQPTPNNTGFIPNKLEDIFDTKLNVKLPNEKRQFNAYYLNANDISRIGEKYSNDTDVKALQQILNSSGMTLANEALGSEGLKLITLMSKFTKSFAEDINKFIENVGADGTVRRREDPENYKELISIVVRHLYRMAKSPTGSLTSNFAKVFPMIVYAYEAKNAQDIRVFSDEQIYEFMKQFSYMPLVVEAMDNFMNEVMSPSVSYETRGQSLPVTPDLGKLSPTRIYEMTKAYARDLEFQVENNELLKEKRREFLEQAFAMIPATDPDRNQKAKKIADKKNDKLIEWYKKINAKAKDPNVDTEEGSLERRKYEIQAKAFAEAEKWFKKVTDDDQFLNRDYCYITASTAKKLKLKVGDKVLVTIIPSAGLMEAKGLTIAGILNENGSASPGSIVVNHDWFQGIGRDFDIDVLNLAVKPKVFTNEEWDFAVEEFRDIEKRYVDQTYKIFTEVLGQDYIDNQLSKYDEDTLNRLSEFDKKMLVAFNDRVFTDYQRKYLGAQDNFKGFYSVVENRTLYLGDNFFKDVGYVIVLRTLHQYLASTRLSFTISYLNEKGEKEEKTVDFGNKEIWNKAHLSLMIGTQHQVDYPKTTSKDEYDFRAESYFAKMMGFDKPFKELPKDLQDKIQNIYIVFRNNLSGLRVASYKRIERKGEELTKFESAVEKLKDYSNLQRYVTKQLTDKGITNIVFNESNPKNPYVSYVESIKLNKLENLSDVLKHPKIENLHTYSKIIEYKILGKYLTDLDFPILDQASLPYIERNLKLVAQFFWKITGADKDGKAIIQENQERYNDQQSIPKMLNEIRNKGSVSSIHYSQLITSKSTVNPKLLANLQEGSLVLFANHDLQSTDNYTNAISYTQAIFFEGVKSTTYNALAEGYKLLRKYVESEFKKEKFSNKTLRSFLVKIYGLPKYPFEQLTPQQQAEMFHESILEKKDEYIKKFEESKALNKDTAYEQKSGGNYYNYVRDLLGMTETPTVTNYQSIPKAEQYIFDFYITTDDLFVNGFSTGLMNQGIDGTFDPLLSTANKTVAEFTKKRHLEIYEIAKLMMIMNQVMLQKDSVTSEEIIGKRSNVAKIIGVTKINPYYWVEIGKKVVADFTKEPKPEAVAERSKMKLRVSENSFIEIDYKGERIYKLYDGDNIEEEIGELDLNSKIYKILTSNAFWNNSYHYQNKMEVKKYFDLMNKETFSLDEREQVLNKVIEQYFLEEGLAYRAESGLVVPTEEAQRYLVTALKWMVGFNEMNQMSNTLYQSGVNIDNRILLALMSRWSPETRDSYLAEYANLQKVGDEEYLQQLNYSAYDFEINKHKRPRRMNLEDYWDRTRKSHHPEVYLKEKKEGGFMYTTPIKSLLLLPKNFDTLNTQEEIEYLKEQIVELAMDVNTLKVTAIQSSPLAFISEFSNVEKINDWLDRSFENIEEHIRNAKAIETLKAVYVDLQLIKQSYDYEMIRERDYDAKGDVKVKDQTDFITWIARGNERLDFTIHDNFEDARMRLAARMVRFDGGFATEEVTEEEKRMIAFVDRVSKKDYSKVKEEERVREKELAYAYKQELKTLEKERKGLKEFEFYLIDPKTAFILSQGVSPFNTEFTGLRPFGLMSLNYAKMRMLMGDLNVATQKIKNLVKEITNIVPFPDVNQKISQSMEDRISFDANVYEMADKILGKQVSFSVTESKGKFKVTIEDQVYHQNFPSDTEWLRMIAKKLELPDDNYTLAVLYSSIKMRSLFDFHLNHYIKRMNYYLNLIVEKELADDSTIFKNEINHIRMKYKNMNKNFSRYRKIGESVYTEKVTPKVFLSSEVLNTYATQRYTSRLRYYTEHFEEFSEEEKARVRDLIENDGIKAELQTEIENRIGGATFYVPLFSYMRDNDLGNYFPSFEMMEEHIFGALFKMIESDMATVYYYQSKIYAMRNGTPEFDQYHLDRWFAQFSDPVNLKHSAVKTEELQENDFIFFYTYQYDEEGAQSVVIRSGKVSSVSNAGFEITGYEGERVFYSDDEIFISDFSRLNAKVSGMVYRPRTLDYWTELEKRVTFNQASHADLAQYYALKGMSELFVSTQMLTIGAYRTYLVNKWGGNVNMLTLAGYKMYPSELTAAYQGKVPKMPKLDPKDKVEFDRFLSMANSMSGLQPLDVAIGSATALGMDLPVFSRKAGDNIAFLAKVLKKNTKEYDGVLRLKEEVMRLIEDINDQVSKGKMDISDGQDLKKELMDIYRSVAYNINLNIFSVDGAPEQLSEEDAQRLEELMLEVMNNPQKTANLYGLTIDDINKAIASFRWRSLKRFGSEKSKAPEEQLRTSSFHIGYKLAIDNGAKPEEAVAWGLRFTDQSQVVYDRFARKIGTDNVWKGYLYLMSNYAHQQQMYVRMMLDEVSYDKLAGFLKSNFDFTFDSYKFIEGEVIPHKKAMKITNESEFKAKIKEKLFKKKDLKNINIDENVGANTLNKLIKLLTVTSILDSMNRYIFGLKSIQSPVIAPLLALLNMLLSFIDDGELEKRDFLWTVNMLLGMKYGVGVGMIFNGISTAVTSAIDEENVAYGFWSGLMSPAMSTRIGSISRAYSQIDFNIQSVTEGLMTANTIVAAAAGFKVNANEMKKVPLFANLGEELSWWQKFFIITADNLAIPFPGGSATVKLFYELPEFDRGLDRQKKYERMLKYQEMNK